MSPGGVPSSAAVCTVTVRQTVLDSDVMLQMLLKVANPHQCHVVIDKKSELSLQFHSHHHVLTQRNAIVRALTGPALLGALDQAPLYLAGGKSSNRLDFASLTAWMSVADQVRHNKEPQLLTSLEKHLQHHAFLIPSAIPTAADYDLALALSKTDTSDFSSVTRWKHTVFAVLHELLPDWTPSGIPKPDQDHQPPLFYYGTEDVVFVLKNHQQTAQQPKTGVPNNKSKEKPTKASSKEEAAPKPTQKQQKQQPQQATEYDISALDMRVGQIIKVWPHESADKLYCEEIDLGMGEIRQVASGLRPYYQESDLLHSKVIVLCNLKKRNLVGFPSHGMVLCASNVDHSSVELIVPPPDAALGERVVFDGYGGDPEPEQKVAKKKIFEKVAPDLKTNDHGQVVWKGVAAGVSAGLLRAMNGMAHAQVS